MKITTKLITQDGKYSTKDIKRLDLTNSNISAIDSLEDCINLSDLILSHNEINDIYGLEKCRELWRFDINNNRLKSLEGLSKFLGIGTLNLYGNDINWTELEKIRHLHIVDLITLSNPKLDKDPYYRYHAIDCLPNVWMIDGLLVTALERNQVLNFFDNSAKTQRPVRRKLPKLQFIPTDLKKRDIFGSWATKLVSKFPVNEKKTLDTDMRRLEFIAEWFENVIINECKEYANYLDAKSETEIFINSPTFQKNFLKDLLDFRKVNPEMCNMILVLIVASLYFDVPTVFFDEMLTYTNLSEISGSYETIKLFCLPYNCRIYLCNLLLSAVKIDRDQYLDAGFYESLFNSIKTLLNDSLRSLNDNQEERFIKNFQRNTNSSNTNLKESKYLLATEIIQLFCIVPTFYEHLFLKNGLIDLLKLGVDEPRIFEAIQNFINDNISQKKTNKEISQQVGSFINNLLKLNARQQFNKKMKSKKNNNSDLDGQSTASEILVQKNMSQLLTTFLTPKIEAIKRLPNVGDNLVVGKKAMGRIVKFDKIDTPATVKFENCDISELTNEIEAKSENNLLVPLNQFEWDSVRKFWKPEGSSGDINTFNYNGDIRKLIQNNHLNSILKPSSQLSNNSTITNTTTVIKMNIEASSTENIFEKAKSEVSTSEKENFNTQFVNSESNFDKEDKEKILERDEESTEVNKILQAYAESTSTSKPSTVSKEKQVNFTLDLTFKENLNVPNTPKAINTPQTPTSKANIVLDTKQDTILVPSKSAYHSRGFQANKLTRVSRSAAPALCTPTFNPSLKTSKPIPVNRALRIVQTALVTKKLYKNYMNNNEFQFKWNEDENMDDVKILDDNQNESGLNLDDTNNIKPRENINNVSIESNIIPYNAVQNFHVNLPVTTENHSHELIENKVPNGNYSFIEPMEDKSPYNECELDQTEYTENYVNNNLGMKFLCQEYLRESKNSTPDTNKLDKTNLTEISCLKCLTSLGYNHHNIREASPAPVPYHDCDACNAITGYQMYDNIYYVNKINYDGHARRNRKKQTIKLQDCTTWLALTNKTSYENQYGKVHKEINERNLPNQLVLKFNQDKPDFPIVNSTTSSEQLKSVEKINMLINRKSARVLTYPKKPILTSPSSQAHTMCKGLRPKNANITINPISIVSKKIEAPNKK